MTSRRIATQLSQVICTCTAIALSGCGGGGGGGGSAGIDGSGAPAAIAKASSGPINGFGSVIVNGVRYDTDNASILISGKTALESDLDVGNYVTVIGTVADDGQTGVATEVRFQPNVIGPISNLSPTSDSFTVLGQTIRVTDATAYSDNVAPRNLNGLTLADVVEVSGSLNSSNTIVATSVEILETEDLELFGVISNFEENSASFTLNGFSVDYSSAVEIEPSSDALENGVIVIVEGSSLSGDTLIADAVFVESSPFGSLDDIEDFTVEGLVTEFTDSNNFFVNGVQVLVTGDTELINGTLATLATDVFVEVEGELNDSNVLVAESVEFLTFPDTVIFGQVEDIDVSNGVVATGTLVVSGLQIVTSVETQYEDYSESDIPQFDLTDINIGDSVAVSGYIDNEQLVAEFIEREEGEDAFETEIQGIVTDVFKDTLILFGFTVSVGEGTEFYVDGEEISGEEFFETAEGQLIEVEGLVDGVEILAEQLSIITEEEDE